MGGAGIGKGRATKTMKTLEKMGKFATVVVDPPWDIQMGPVVPEKQWGDTAPALPYARMTLQEIADIAIEKTLADDAMVFCWTTNRLLADTFPILSAWGTRYWFALVWHKNDGMQTPGNPRHTAEFAVVGRKGSPKLRDTKAFRTANCWPRRGHSEKPEGFYDLLRRVTPGPRLDVFGRRRIAGFQSWGNEAPQGPALPDHYQTVMFG